MSFPARCRLALKEWAVTERALAQGEQVLLLRKGGIHEEGKEFRVVHREFLLYPTYEHQREDLLKLRYREELRAVLAEPHNPQQITLSQWARVQEVIEVTERQKVEALSPHYIWTTDYAEQRLHWKPRSCRSSWCVFTGWERPRRFHSWRRMRAANRGLGWSKMSAWVR